MNVDKIIIGDAAEELVKLDDDFIDLVVTSPPYDLLRKNSQYSAEFDFPKIAKDLYRVLKDGGVLVWVVGDQIVNNSESLTSFKQAIHFVDVVGFNLWDTMIYQKHSFTHPETVRYHQVFEYMFVFSKGKPKTFNPIMDRENKYLGKRGASGRNADGSRRVGQSEVKNKMGKRFNIWQYTVGKHHSTKDEIAFQHPALFPEKLAEDHILSWSNPGDIVLDCFAGSGTTCKMAKLNGRKWIAIEKSKEYCSIIEERLKDVIS